LNAASLGRAQTIIVFPPANGAWRVEVRGATATTHEGTIPAGHLAALGVASVVSERVSGESFCFLLEREPNTSILARSPCP